MATFSESTQKECTNERYPLPYTKATVWLVEQFMAMSAIAEVLLLMFCRSLKPVANVSDTCMSVVGCCSTGMHWSCAWSNTLQWPRTSWKNWRRPKRWKSATLKRETRSWKVSGKCAWHSASTTSPPRSSHSVATELRSDYVCCHFSGKYIESLEVFFYDWPIPCRPNWWMSPCVRKMDGPRTPDKIFMQQIIL